MKKFLKENALKLTVFGNMIAHLGTAYFLGFLFLLLVIYLKSGGSVSGEPMAFLIIFITIGYLIVSAIVILGFILELLFRHRLKNEFFKENKIYNILFYIGLSLTLFSFLCISLIYYGYIEQNEYDLITHKNHVLVCYNC